MTYITLLEVLNNQTYAQLSDDVTVKINGEFFKIDTVVISDPQNDVLHSNHIYLEVSNG